MSKEAYKGTVRLTVAQAIIRFLSCLLYTSYSAGGAAGSREMMSRFSRAPILPASSWA